MNCKRVPCVGVLALFAVLLTGIAPAPVPLFAHHGSGVSYDTRVEKLVTMKGIVTEWVWRNPHCFILYEVKDADGEAVQWTAETSSTFSMTGEFGWSRTTLNPGDEITISVAPSRAGTAAGLLYKVVASDGEVLIEDPSRLLEERRPFPLE